MRFYRREKPDNEPSESELHAEAMGELVEEQYLSWCREWHLDPEDSVSMRAYEEEYPEP